MQAQGEAIANRGQDSTTRREPRAVRRRHATLVSILNRGGRGYSRLISNTGVVFGALDERTGSSR